MRGADRRATPVPMVQQVRSVTLQSASDLDRLAELTAQLLDAERPFGIVLTVDGLHLDRHHAAFSSVRRLPGGRARFGTWSRGMAYVFGPRSPIITARAHLGEADRVWGTKIFVARDEEEAAAWMKGEFQRYAERR